MVGADVAAAAGLAAEAPADLVERDVESVLPAGQLGEGEHAASEPRPPPSTAIRLFFDLLTDGDRGGASGGSIMGNARV
jgi:hypothetical protein